jgi:hypothetical protein
MLRRAVLTSWAAVSAVALWGQSQVQIDAKSQPAVAQLAVVAHAIKQCPRQLESERQWGKKPIEIERWYIGPPQNVAWDVVPDSSVRAPYLGFIEFSLPENYWVPDDVKDKFEQSEAGGSARLAHLMDGPVKHRYEFDVGPAGLEFAKMLGGGKPEWLDDRPDDTCWQKAARSVHASDDAHQRDQLPFHDSGKEFLDQCESTSGTVTDQTAVTSVACHAWLSGFADGIQTTEILAGKNVVCVPQDLNNEQAMRVVIKYMKDHPDQLHLPALALALRALKEAFPCEEKR